MAHFCFPARIGVPVSAGSKTPCPSTSQSRTAPEIAIRRLDSVILSAVTISLVFYYHRLNRYSFNALAGALDADPELAELPISLAKTENELKTAAAGSLSRGGRTVIAFSVLASQLAEMRNLARQLRSEFGADITIIAGGAHATADPARILGSGIDIVFRGEAEVSFTTVLKRLARGQEFRGVAGIAFRTDQEVVVNQRALPVDLDAFASISPRRGMTGPVEVTRGCPFACSFCQTSHIFGVHPRHRSVDNIVRQAAGLRSRNRKIVRVLSPNAFSYGSPDGRQLNLAATGELLAALDETVGPQGRVIFGHFPSEVRPEHVTPETLELMRRYADNDEIVIGAQSGSQRMLDACHRSHSVGHVVSAVSLARRFGYKVIVDFILGLPGENEQDARDTVRVMEELFRLGARVHPHAFVPLPQTAFAAERPGRISRDILNTLDRLEKGRALYGDLIAQRQLADRVCRDALP